MRKIQGPSEGYKHIGVYDRASYREVHRKAMANAGLDVEVVYTTVTARVNHGRWIVDCDDCHGAGLTCPHDYGISVCFNCGRVYPHVLFPKSVARIEDLLMLRPNIKTRNWGGESVSELQRQNKAHLPKGE
jgi:hypothetical protein